jgi:hypothetical protein
MNNAELAKAIRLPVFADRETLDEAWEYATDLMMGIGERDRVAALTAMMVMLNTVSKLITKNEEKHPLHDAFIRQTKEA